METYTIITFLATVILLVFLPVVIETMRGLLKPGRKGRLRTTDKVFVSGGELEEIRRLFIDRLEKERFLIDAMPESHRIKLKRSMKKVTPYSIPVFTFSNVPMKGEILFEPQAGGADVTLTLWYDTIVYSDDGEGLYIENLIKRLLTGDLETEPAPMIPHITSKAHTVLETSILMCLFPLVYFLPFFEKLMGVGLITGLAFYAIVNICLGAIGIQEIRKNPQEFLGRKLITWGIFLTVAAPVFAFLLFIFVFS